MDLPPAMTTNPSAASLALRLGVPDGHPSSVQQAERPESIAALHRKIAGERLHREELLFRAVAMVVRGQRLDSHEPLVADKHCIGGMPDNRTSIPVVQDDVLYGVYAACPADLEFARAACAGATEYTLGETGQVPHVFVEF